jgi:apolipoprotein D and lipocalin family protein
MARLFVWLPAFAALSLVIFQSAAAKDSPVQAVPALDLKRYAGKWYEIARLPNRFQRKCIGDVTATYTLRTDGKITVLNECAEAGKTNTAKGTAKRARNNGPNSKLKVTFFWPFYGDYWVLALDPEYQWALVGEPERKYLWVLSRSPQMDEAQLKAVLQRATEQGYDLSGLIRTRQSAR